MNISGITPYYNSVSNNTRSRNLNFRGNKLYTLRQIEELSKTSEADVADGLTKLVSKIRFINKILGQDSKTLKPVTTKIAETPVDIMMDKTGKGKTKINIVAYSDASTYVSPKAGMYERVNEEYIWPQTMDIILDNKDGRMINGELDTKLNSLSFVRNSKTGRRTAEGRYFFLVPNVYECKDIKNRRDNMIWYSKTSNTISLIFQKLFADLSLVKPKNKLV